MSNSLYILSGDSHFIHFLRYADIHTRVRMPISLGSTTSNSGVRSNFHTRSNLRAVSYHLMPGIVLKKVPCLLFSIEIVLCEALHQKIAV